MTDEEIESELREMVDFAGGLQWDTEDYDLDRKPHGFVPNLLVRFIEQNKCNHQNDPCDEWGEK